MPESPAVPPAPIRLLPHPRRLVELGPHNGAHRVAIRAGIAIAVPLVTLYLTGHIDLALYAVFGAFTALYGRSHTHLTRLRMQATAGLALVACVVIGTAIGVSPSREWLVVPVAAVVAGVATVLSDALHWHPPGALFFVFALAACASVPSEPRQILIAFLLAAASAVFALVVSTAGLALPAARRRTPTNIVPSLGRALARPGALVKVLSVVAAVAVAGAVPTATGLGHPYWAMVSAVAALSAADVTGHLVRAGHRVLGTFAGLALAAALLAVSSNALVLIVFVVLLQMAAELFVLRNYGLTMVFVTPLALIMSYLAFPHDEWALVRDRALETLLGAAVGIAVSLTAAALARAAPSRGSRAPRA
ncbi:FUSC family protein [Herbiconiux sp.]|uniref:FUSC family protein n=1 Tax=Herbiconiux sp. TaxID=1871186 RepID=UPI0025C2513E|nr:FUSC family protein [Herbiconiux sp.]